MERLAVPVRTSSQPQRQLERIRVVAGFFLCIDCGLTVFPQKETGKHLETELRLAEKLGDPIGSCLPCGNLTSRWVGAASLQEGVSV